jgi:acyl carrier protein
MAPGGPSHEHTPTAVMTRVDARRAPSRLRVREFKAGHMDTLDQIRGLAAKRFGRDPHTIDPDVAITTLGADSLGFLEFLFELEDHFGITIPQEDAGQVSTLRDLAAWIDRLVQAQNARTP